jgi:hypothetical protein
MTFGQIFDRTFRLMRANLRLFLGVAAVPAGAFFLIFALVFAVAFAPIIVQLPKQPDPAAFSHTFIPLIFLMFLLNGIVFALYLAASIHAAAQADRGEKITFREAYGTAWKRGWRYLWLLFLAYIIAFLPALVTELAMIVPMGLFAMGKSDPATTLVYMIPLEMLLFFAAIVYGIIMTMRLSLAFPASLAENLTAWAAIRRSGQLTQGAKGRIFLILLLIYALGYAAEMVGCMVLMAIFGIGALVAMALHVKLASVAGIIGIVLLVLCVFAFIFLWMTLLWSAFTTAFAVLYHDQRVRKEGFLPVAEQAGEVRLA